MPVERFFLPANFVDKSTVSLIENELQHLKVLRFKTGDELELANGQGGLAKAKVIEIEKRIATLEILSSTKTAPPKFHILLAVPLMRPSKLEWIVEKGTELGADAFIFYLADHSEKETLSEHQIERLRFLSIAALKQSGRLYLPHLEILPRLNDIFSRKSENQTLHPNPFSKIEQYIPKEIEELEIGQGGSPDFLVETRDIVGDKARCKNEKYGTKPTLHQNRFFNHERYTFLFGDTGNSPMISIPKEEQSIIFISGPEKGFSKNEESLLRQKAQGVRINPNILRAETAPIAAMSLLAQML